MATPLTAAQKSWTRYSNECQKYSLPRLTAVENIVFGRTSRFNMRNYCPHSIGLWLAFETFVQNPELIVSHIDVSNSPFTESGCHTLNDLILQSTRLEDLNLANCRIGYRGIRVLEEGLNDMRNITILNLSGCNMRDIGGVIVARAFGANSPCTSLNLAHNLLSSETGRELGDMLKLNDQLEWLELGWNSLYAEKQSIVPLFGGLKTNVRLQYLGLSWNGIMNEPNGVEAMRKALTSNKALETLDMENNRMTGMMDELTVGFQRSRSLQTCKLGGNPLSESDIESALLVLKKPTRALANLSLGKYKWITKEHEQILKKVLQKNPGLRIEFAGILMSNPPQPVDFRKLLMARLKTLAMKPKRAKRKRNMGLFFLQLLDGEEKSCTMDEWLDKCHAFKAKIDDPLCVQIANEWKSLKTGSIEIHEIAEYYLSLYPTERPPPVVKIERKPKASKKGKKKA